MTYNSQAALAQQVDSAELFTITYSGRESHWTSYYRDVEYGGVSYKAVTISRSEIAVEFGPDEVSCNVRGGLDETFSFLRLGIPITNVEITIARVFLTTGAVNTLFTGRLKDYTMSENTAACQFTSTLFFVLRQSFVALQVVATCGNDLFDTRCTLSRAQYKATGKVTEIGETADGYPYIIVENSGADAWGEGPQDKAEQYYALGMVQLTDFYRAISDSENADGAGRKRLILEFAFPTDRIAIGSTVNVWPGCDKISHTCYLRFANYANFWGYQRVKAESHWNPGHRPDPDSYTDLELTRRDVPVYFGFYAVKGACIEQSITTVNGVGGSTSYGILRYRTLLGWGPITPIAILETDSSTVTSTDNPYRIVWHNPGNIFQYFPVFNLGDGTVAVPVPVPPGNPVSPYEAVPQFPYLAAYALWIDSGSTAFPTGWHVADALATMFNETHVYELLVAFERVPVTPWSALDRIEVESEAEVPPGGTGWRAVWVGVNPASAIYDILTDVHWGMGVAAADIDVAFFAATAQYCYDKCYGLAFQLTVKSKMQSVIEDICSAAGLMLCYSSDGKIKCVAVNDTSTSVATITDQDMIDSEYAAGSWDSTFNRLVVKQAQYLLGNHIKQDKVTAVNYIVPDADAPDLSAQNAANRLLTGSWREATFDDVMMISTGKAVRMRRMYERLFEVSYPRSVITCKVDQRFAVVSIGDCVQVQSVRYAVSGAFRVIAMTHGDDDARHITMRLQQIQESTFDMNYVSAFLAQGYDEEGEVIELPRNGEVLAFAAYDDTSAVSTATYADRTRVRVSWYGHTVLSGELLTDQQDAVNYQCTVNDEGGGTISVTLRSPLLDTTIQGNATGQLSVQVWEV